MNPFNPLSMRMRSLTLVSASETHTVLMLLSKDFLETSTVFFF